MSNGSSAPGSSATERSLVFSYLAHRLIIGVLGFSFPFVLYVGALWFFQEGLQGSLSAYYHTGMRDVFVGALFAIGFFLLSYPGYKEDTWTSRLAFVSALGVALVPTSAPLSTAVPYLHYTFAAVFLSTLAYFSLRRFTRSKAGVPPSEKKLQRNRFYTACGYVMVACLVLLLVYFVLPQDIKADLDRLYPVFVLESVAIVAFGISWLVKGQAILKDLSSTSNELLTRQWFRELWNNGDESAIDRLLTDDVVAHGLPDGRIIGKDAFRDFYRGFKNDYPSVEVQLEHVLESGDYVSFVAEAKLTTPQDETFSLPGIGLARFRGGAIQEAWNSWDFLGLMVQRGLFPPEEER